MKRVLEGLAKFLSIGICPDSIEDKIWIPRSIFSRPIWKHTNLGDPIRPLNILTQNK